MYVKEGAALILAIVLALSVHFSISFIKTKIVITMVHNTMLRHCEAFRSQLTTKSHLSLFLSLSHPPPRVSLLKPSGLGREKLGCREAARRRSSDDSLKTRQLRAPAARTEPLTRENYF